jgi:type IV pilus assembly protein PilE
LPTNGRWHRIEGLGLNNHHQHNRFAMNPTTPHISTAHHDRGFTLVELVITIAVVAILAALAYPSFLSAIRKSRRSDAVAALTSVQQAQERWRNNKAAYAGNGVLTTAAPDGLGLSATSSSGHYSISIADADASGYKLIASAANGSTQLLDDGCQAMSITLAGGNLTYGGANSGAASTDPKNCWVR